MRIYVVTWNSVAEELLEGARQQEIRWFPTRAEALSFRESQIASDLGRDPARYPTPYTKESPGSYGIYVMEIPDTKLRSILCKMANANKGDNDWEYVVYRVSDRTMILKPYYPTWMKYGTDNESRD